MDLFTQLLSLILASVLRQPSADAAALAPRHEPVLVSCSSLGSSPQPTDARLNINTATSEQWALLPRIGPTTAARIVAYREQRGLQKIAALMRVKGIGKKTYAEIRPYLTVDGETTLKHEVKLIKEPAGCGGAKRAGAG